MTPIPPSGDGPPNAPTVPVAAATVVPLRTGVSGLEVLMLRRNPEIYFGGAWVFPGGRIDPGDRAGDENRDAGGDAASPSTDLDDRSVLSLPNLVDAARRAAVREAREEAGLNLGTASLTWFAHWLPPSFRPRRFATWFFLAPAPDQSVNIDGGEIHGHRWIRPADALAAHTRGEMDLVIPTWVTLHLLVPHPTPDSAISALGAGPPLFFHTDLRETDQGRVAIWEGDASYRQPDPHTPGRRRRLTMMGREWRIEGL